MEYAAGELLKRDSENDTAWSILAFVYTDRPDLEHDFERLTLNWPELTLEVWRKHRGVEYAA